MSLITDVSLALTQGVAEFLPISSTGHLHLFQTLSGQSISLSLDIILHLATLASVLFFFRGEIKYFFTNLLFIIVGSIPATIVGILFKSQIESIFSRPELLPYFFLITAILLFLTQFFSAAKKKLTITRALIIGVFQVLAILPGVSRSGATIFAGLLVGLSPLDAFRFSFSLFIPATFGSALLDIKDLSLTGFSPLTPILTFFIGLVALKTIKDVLKQGRLHYFAFYCLFISAVSFYLLF